MRFDQRAEARAVNLMDALKINYNFSRARREEVFNGCTKTAALFSQYETSVELQKIYAVHFALRNL